jgi:hypothetical protein
VANFFKNDRRDALEMSGWLMHIEVNWRRGVLFSANQQDRHSN